jgi:hypothetical protein
MGRRSSRKTTETLFQRRITQLFLSPRHRLRSFRLINEPTPLTFTTQNKTFEKSHRRYNKAASSDIAMCSQLRVGGCSNNKKKFP